MTKCNLCNKKFLSKEKLSFWSSDVENKKVYCPKCLKKLQKEDNKKLTINFKKGFNWWAFILGGWWYIYYGMLGLGIVILVTTVLLGLLGGVVGAFFYFILMLIMGFTANSTLRKYIKGCPICGKEIFFLEGHRWGVYNNIAICKYCYKNKDLVEKFNKLQKRLKRRIN